MARKKNRKSRRPAKSKPIERISWSATDRLHLLVYLNWCVERSVKFEVTAPGYLEKATGKRFSKEQVQKKLYQEWHTYGKCDKFKDLLVQGTAGLEPFVGEEQDRFDEITRSINTYQEVRCTRSRSSAARSSTFSAPHSTYSISSSREPNGLSSPQTGNSNVVQDCPGQKTKTNSSFRPTRLASNNDPSKDELANDHNTDRVKSEGRSKSSTIASPELSDMECELVPAIRDSPGDNVAVTPQAQLHSSPETMLRQLNADLLKQKSYCITLENRMSELKRKNYDLEHCISLAIKHGSHGKEARFRENIATLKEKLRRSQLLTKKYEELEADRLGFLNTSRRAFYDDLYSNIRDTSSTICHLALDDALPEQRTDFSHSANSWARRIGGRDLSFLLSHCELAQIPKKVTLISLLVAGIFELVLEEVFPAFLAVDSPLLDQYREHIETQSGWNALQRLDIISIRSLLSDAEVEQGIISEKSTWLSSLLLQHLSCFLPLESRDITQRSPRNELEADTISDMRSTLHHALKFKIELMMSVKRLKYLFIPPGTPFNGDRMEVVRSQAGDPALLSQEVKICLLPALFTTSEAGEGGGAVEESSLMTNYTKALGEVMDEDIESLVLEEKAIVFL